MKMPALALLVLLATAAGAQQEHELLQPVDPALASRLEEYNSAFLKEHLYFAARHRIVRPNSHVLFEEHALTVTPFEDMEPLALMPRPGTPERSWENAVFWKGCLRVDPLCGLLGPAAVGLTVAAHGWELDGEGNARVSSRRRDEHAFWSVQATLEVPGGSKYVLMPLKYTPKYSVVYEITPDTLVPIRIDFMPGDPEPSATEKAAWARYRAFVDSLPREDGKPVRGDIQ